MTAMISVNGLSKRFGHLLAVDNVSLSVDRGEVLGFLGPNGSGKSTTMKMITGFLAPSAGSVEVGGIDVLANPIAAQKQFGYLPEGAPAYSEITVSAYLKFIAEVRGLERRQANAALEYVVERTHIAGVLQQPIETLSKGYKRRVGLAQSLLHDPDVLILDEPTDGLDPNQKYEVRKLIGEIAKDKAILISTHILEEVEAICDRALIIAEGRVKAEGTPQEFQQRSQYFNAVSLTLNTEHIDDIRSEIESLSDVATVQKSIGGDAVELTALPENGKDILTQIAPMARERSWPVVQLQLKRVHLDDVFRAITFGDSETQERVITRPQQKGVVEARAPLLRNSWTICKRELLAYFSTPIAYVFIVIFLAAMGAFTFFLGAFIEQGQASLDSFFQFHPWLYLFLIPAVAMRLWAEERKSGSIELLLTLPVSTFSAVIGKFCAAWIVAGVGLLLTSTIWITVNYLGSPDNSTILSGYIGSFFMAGGYLAIGAFVSALTKNQVIAFIAAAALCFLFTASGLSVVLDFFSDWAPTTVLDAVAGFSFLGHFRDVSRGVIDVRDVVFALSTIAFFLFANVVALEYKKNA